MIRGKWKTSYTDKKRRKVAGFGVQEAENEKTKEGSLQSTRPGRDASIDSA